MRPLPKLLILLACSAPTAGADTASRVADLVPGPVSGVPNLQAVVFNGQLHFAGRDDTDLDLWVYNGIDPPTEVPGTAATAPYFPAVWNGAIYFRGQTGSDAELWLYDGITASEALDLNPAASSFPDELTPFGGQICFRATLPMIGGELVCWDGLGSAFDSFDLHSGSNSSLPKGLAVAQNRLYFKATEPLTGTEPWSYDGLGSPAMVDDVRPGTLSSLPYYFTALGSDLFFSATLATGQGRLFRYDGVNPPAVVAPNFRVTGALSEFRGRLYVVGRDEAAGTIDTLWRLDGSTLVRVGGTTALDLVDSFAPLAQALYFVSGQTLDTSELFRYSGVGPPVAVTNFAAQPADIPFRQLTTFDGRLFFVGKDASAGTELWSLTSNHIVSDGFEHGNFSAWSAVQP